MARVLFVGQQPETVDFTSPMLPPGMNAERIHAGITLALKQMAERGWHADLCLLRPDETAGPDVERRLKAQAYDCVVIGAGIRLPPHSLSMFEAVINAVHRAAPDAAIAFNTRPEDSADAGSRRTLRQTRDLGDVPYAPLSVLRSQPSVELLVALGVVTTVDLVRTIEVENATRSEGGLCASH